MMLGMYSAISQCQMCLSVCSIGSYGPEQRRKVWVNILIWVNIHSVWMNNICPCEWITFAHMLPCKKCTINSLLSSPCSRDTHNALMLSGTRGKYLNPVIMVFGCSQDLKQWWEPVTVSAVIGWPFHDNSGKTLSNTREMWVWSLLWMTQ